MRAVKAKRIRKGVYGDQSLRGPRRYYRVDNSTTIVNAPPRGMYLRLKRAAGKRHAALA